VSPVRLRGALVGWKYADWSHYGSAGYVVVVRDMATGRTLHRAEHGGEGSEAFPAWWADNFVMDAAGSVAWIATESPSTSGEYHVFKSDTTRGAEPLDSGPAIDPKSLRRRGKVIFWRNGNETRTATFVR
jgi:hypothetical protein